MTWAGMIILARADVTSITGHLEYGGHPVHTEWRAAHSLRAEYFQEIQKRAKFDKRAL